ncbi:MAG: hypothetical protein LUC37_02790 [Prevotella sp.]|nr:hypothetical protein [Prevotella sp.]
MTFKEMYDRAVEMGIENQEIIWVNEEYDHDDWPIDYHYTVKMRKDGRIVKNEYKGYEELTHPRWE